MYVSVEQYPVQQGECIGPMELIIIVIVIIINITISIRAIIVSRASHVIESATCSMVGSEPDTVEQGTLLDNAPDLGCSQACFTQWSEGDTVRVAIHLLGHTGETDCEEDTSWLCCLSKV